MTNGGGGSHRAGLLGVGSIGMLAVACCIRCCATGGGPETPDPEADMPAPPGLPPKLLQTKSRLKSVLAALDRA